MRTTLLCFLAFLSIDCSAQQNNLCFRYPVRVIDGRKIDLQYLFNHWMTKTNAVTNSNWVRITGIVAGNDAGWIVDGKTLSASGIERAQKVIVMHPPYREKALFDQLYPQIMALGQRNSALNNAVNGNESAAEGPAFKARVRDAVGLDPGQAGATVVALGRQSSAMMKETYANANLQEQLGRQLAMIPSRSTPEGRVYEVDFFALWTGKVRGQLAVLDFGIPTTR